MKAVRTLCMIIGLLLCQLPIYGASLGNDSLPADTFPHYRHSVGLVLSGGGAKGIAHVGVIKALEENDIPIDYIAGTSMGAIVGSLYSCGWTPDSMLNFFKSPDFGYWSTGVINPADKFYFSQPEPTPQWLGVNLNFRDSSVFSMNILPTNLISPLPMNIEFLKLYAPYTRQCGENFNRLFVPLRTVCSDVYHKHKIVCRSGSLGDAVRASMSFPLVFKPIKLDGVLVYDGGIYDNFPVDVMQEDFNPEFIIGVSVSSADKSPQQGNIYSQLEDMIIQNNDYSVPPESGVKIQVPVLQFGVLDFGKAQEIFEIGYRTGLAMVDSIKKRTVARRSLESVNDRRRQFTAQKPVIMFDSVAVEGATPSQAKYITFLFDRGLKHRPFGMTQTQNAYYQAVTDGKLSNLVPQAEFRGDSTTLLLEATVKNSWNIGVGGWISSSTNSMLYLTFGYHTLRFNSLDADISAWLGQTYYAGMARVKFALHSVVPSYMQLTGVISRQKFYSEELLFYQNNSPSFISDYQAYVRLQYCRAVGRKAKAFADIGYGFLWDKYFPIGTTDFSDSARDKSRFKVGALRLGLEYNTLNDITYPSRGALFQATLLGTLENCKNTVHTYPELGSTISDHKLRLEILWKYFFSIHRHFTLGAYANGMATLHGNRQLYTPALISAPAFAPTPSTSNYFNQGFRSQNYVAAGVMPIYLPVSNLQLRGDFYVYAPIRNEVRRPDGRLGYDGWLRKARFLGEVAAVYNFPFASLSVYCNYLSYPARNWNFGINFGIFLQAPRFER